MALLHVDRSKCKVVFGCISLEPSPWAAPLCNTKRTILLITITTSLSTWRHDGHSLCNTGINKIRRRSLGVSVYRKCCYLHWHDHAWLHHQTEQKTTQILSLLTMGTGCVNTFDGTSQCCHDRLKCHRLIDAILVCRMSTKFTSETHNSQ